MGFIKNDTNVVKACSSSSSESYLCSNSTTSYVTVEEDDEKVCTHLCLSCSKCEKQSLTNKQDQEHVEQQKTTNDHNQFITNQRKRSRQQITVNPTQFITNQGKRSRPQIIEIFPNHYHCATTNLCLELTLAPCLLGVTTQIAKKPKLGQQETVLSTKNKKGNKKGLDCSSGHDNDPWKIKKTMEKSDLGSNSRLLINKELAEEFVVPIVLDSVEAQKVVIDEGVKVEICDVDTNSLHSLFFKIQPSNKSHVLKGTWIKDFVNRRDLKKGDQIGFKWNQEYQKFDFSVLIRANPERNNQSLMIKL